MNFKNSRFVTSGAASITFTFVCILSLSWCIYRDIETRKQYPGDLRNRVVGSRLQMDGISPYFYHWKESDGMRYYDWNNGSTNLKLSNITASPFLHQVISPIANFSQLTISKIWVAWNYFMWLCMVIMALGLCHDKTQRALVITTGILFLFSYGWTSNVFNGQMYLMIAFLCMCFYFILTRKPAIINGILAGIFAGAIVLIRPPACLFLVPFLLIAPGYKLRYKLAVLTPVIVLLIISFGPAKSRQYWIDYRLAVGEHIKAHQKLRPSTGEYVSVPTLRHLEGFDLEEVNKAKKFPYYKINSANGNVFVFINKTLNVITPVWLLGAMCIAAIVLLSFLFLKIHGIGSSLTLYSIASLGFLLYIFTDMFSPVYRAQYNLSQWIFPLLITALSWSKSMNKIFVTGLFAGLVLNSLQFSMFRMQQSIGEYIICFSLIALLLTYKPRPAVL